MAELVVQEFVSRIHKPVADVAQVGPHEWMVKTTDGDVYSCRW